MGEHWLIIAGMAASAAGAESPEFCSDRPGLTTGTCVAAPGTFQLEISFVEWSRARGSEELAIASSRLRYGIDGRTDFHVAIAPYLRVDEGGATQHGVGDLAVAVKHVLTAPSAPVAVAIMPLAKLPTGSRAVSNGKWEAGLLIPIDAELPGDWSLTLTPEVDWNADGDGNGRHARYAFAASLGFDLSDRWSASIDGLVAREKDGGETAHELATAFSLAFTATRTLQLDAQIDFGLARDTPDLKLTSGVAFRF